MQEVSTWQNGELDYVKIRGGTGPLAYPAGFLYFYGALKWFAGGGHDIRAAQYLFCLLYVVNAGIVLSIYSLIGRELSESGKRMRRGRRGGTSSMTPSMDSSMDQCHTVWSWRMAMGS